jgi:phosphate transport system protein
MAHYERRLEADLNEIREHVWHMGESVALAMNNARKVLAYKDEPLAYETVLGDNPINRASRECDRLCHRFIARHLPGAGHLREMAATIRVNIALERIGDYAVTICREALQLSGPLPSMFLDELELLFGKSMDILAESRKSFRDHDDELAIAMMQRARNVEGTMDGFYQELFDQDDNMDAPTMLAIFVIYNMLKRVADQAKNICDQTVYAVSGIVKISKTFKILFLARPGSGVDQLAAAIARKNFPGRLAFDCSMPSGSELAPLSLQQFMDEKGLPGGVLADAQAELSTERLAAYDLVVCLGNTSKDYFDKVPFHTSSLSWSLPAADGGDDEYTNLYRHLLGHTTDLVSIIIGDETQ